MKCRLIKEGLDGANPDFDPTAPVGPDNPHSVPRPKGTVIEHPDAWILCVTKRDARDVGAMAEPFDDECREKVDAYRLSRSQPADKQRIRDLQLAALKKANEAREAEEAGDAVEAPADLPSEVPAA